MEHWLFGASFHRNPVSTLFPPGQLRNEEHAEEGAPSTLLGPEGAVASLGRYLERPGRKVPGLGLSTPGSVRILRTA